jgi:signal transduction histidine kinase
VIKSDSKYLVNIVLSISALVFALIIFFIDRKVEASLAIGVLYSLVIFYTYILQFKNASIIAAILCSILLMLANFKEFKTESHADLSNLNVILSFISIWISTALISIAKRSLNQLDQVLNNKSEIIEAKTFALQKLNLELEQKVFNRTRELNEKNKSLEEFAHAASHDLQEPLNTINNFAELIAKNHSKLPDEKLLQYIGFLAESSTRLRSLIQDLLKHTRIGIEIEYSLIDTQEIVEETIKDLNYLIESKQCMLTVEKLPKIRGDESYLRILFQNLIENAIKFGKKDTMNEIEIRARRKEDKTIFSVKDKGIGIPSNKLEHIFTVFKRLHNEMEYPGNGIGLANCKKIVSYHGGKIWAESKLGQGSTFSFSINS